MSLSSADSWFSKFIRLRDADENGIIRCISCGKPVFWKQSDAGHFIKRQHKATRFNEKNANAQCKECNWLKGIVEELEVLGKCTHHLGKFELKCIAENYKEKFKELMNSHERTIKHN